jgi:hypothetical protein
MRGGIGYHRALLPQLDTKTEQFFAQFFVQLVLPASSEKYTQDDQTPF